jgi:hypothetical protein
MEENSYSSICSNYDYYTKPKTNLPKDTLKLESINKIKLDSDVDDLNACDRLMLIDSSLVKKCNVSSLKNLFIKKYPKT